MKSHVMLIKKGVHLAFCMFTLQHLDGSVFAVVAGRNTLHEHIINHTNVCLRVRQRMLLRAVYECQQDQRDKERHIHCLMKRDEKSMMCRAIMEAYFCLICAAKTPKDLSASVPNTCDLHRTVKHSRYLTPRQSHIGTCVYVCVCVCI